MTNINLGVVDLQASLGNQCLRRLAYFDVELYNSDVKAYRNNKFSTK